MEIGKEPLDYFQVLIDFVYDPIFARYLRKIAEQYKRDQIPEEIDIRPFIVDSLIFDTYIKRKTPLDYFIEKHKSVLSRPQLKIYMDFKQAQLSAFKVIESERPEKMILEDLINNDRYLMKDSEAIKFLQKDRYAILRLIPFMEFYIPTGACTIVNSDDEKVVIGLAKLLKVPPIFVEG